MVENKVVINPEARLPQCQEQQVSVGLPAPINERLDQLVELADEEGAKTSRKELLAALILSAPEAAEELARAVIDYRKARARDAAVGGDASPVLSLRRHLPGPRPKARHRLG